MAVNPAKIRKTARKDVEKRDRESKHAQDAAGRELVEQALRESEQRFRATFEQAAVGIAHTTSAGQFLEVNEKLCAMLGYPRDELMRMSTLELSLPSESGQYSALYQEVIEGKRERFSGEKRWLRKDGEVIWVNRTVSRTEGLGGREPYLIQVVEDITDRKRTEARLERLTRARRVMAECDHILVHATDEVGMLESMCRVVVESGGYKMAWVGLATGDLTRPVYPAAHAGFGDDTPMGGSSAWSPDGRYRGFMSEVLESGEPHIARNILQDPTHARRILRARQHGFQSSIALPLKGDGRVLGAIALYAAEPDAFDAEELTLLKELTDDIAFGIVSQRERVGRRKAEAALQESEQQFRATFEQAAVGISRVDLNGVLVDVNQKFCDMLGYGKDELLGKPIRDITHPDDYGKGAQYRAELTHRAMKSAAGEKRFLRKDGTVLWARRTMSTACDAAGRPLYVISVVEDITERKELERQFELTFNQAAVGMTQTSLDGRLLQVNQKYADMLGYARDELYSVRIDDLTHPEDLDETRQMRQKLLDREIDSASSEKRLVRKDGRVIWVNRTFSVARDAAGEAHHYIAVIEDITARKEAEAERMQAEERYRATFDNAPVGIMHTDIDGDRILHANPKLCEMLQYTRDEMLEMATDDILPPEFRGQDRGKYRAQMLKGELGVYSSERKLLRKDGSAIWVNRTVSLVRDAAGDPQYFIRIIEDITERTLSDRRLAMEHAITSTLAEAATIGEALPKVIRTICEGLDWTCGFHWSWDRSAELLRCRERWHRNTDGIEIFVRTSLDMVNEAPSVVPDGKAGGLVRQVWVSGGPVWISDIMKTPDFRRAPAAAQAGLHSAFAFPVLSEGRPVGVMEFFSNEIRQPDEALLQFMRAIGTQIGLFIQRKEAEQALRKSEERYRDVFETSPLPMWIWDNETLAFVDVNRATVDHYGYTRDEFLRMNVRDIWAPGEAARYEENIRMRGQKPSLLLQRRHRTKDGRDIDVEVTARRFTLGGRPVWLTLVNDISERKRAEAALRESEEQFKQLANNIPQVFWITDLNHRETIYISPAAGTITGRPLQALYARPRALIRSVHPEDRRRVFEARKAAAAGGYDQTYRIVRPDGTVRWVNDRAFPVNDETGTVYRIAGIAEDVTDRKLAEERLLQLAHYDVLTSLPNRVLFYDRLRQVLAQAKRNQWIVGVMFVDLDRFKNVNDTLGHAVGDQLLQQVSERLTRSVRAGDTVGRLGGDEFAIVLSSLSSAQDANLVAQKIMASFSEPFKLSGSDIYVTASIGITLYPDDSTDQDALIRNADSAMYRAKEMGRNSYQYYTPEMNSRALEVLGMENSLRRALDRDEFLLYYQPKASISDGGIVGVEALLRWQHPERGLVSPAEFMFVLEETGLIVQVGEWALKRVCLQIKEWQRAGITPVPVAVNLSARQFNAKDLGPAIRKLLDEQAVDPGLIELEITESSLMTNTEDTARMLEALSDIGVGVSIDDFGTGYSSLSYLKRFPLDALKIDRSFIGDLMTDNDDATITRAVISMAHSLGLKVIAEGVETAAQLMFLAEHGCDEIQGYYFARPMAADDCGAWLVERRRLPEPVLRPEPGVASVLLVDDDDETLMLLKHTLDREGYRILLARSASEAIGAMSRQRVDLVITDQSMADMSGIDLLRHVKTAHPDVMRMMTSVHTDFKTIADAVNRGEVFRFLPKEYTPEQMRASVRDALQARRTVLPAAIQPG